MSSGTVRKGTKENEGGKSKREKKKEIKKKKREKEETNPIERCVEEHPKQIKIPKVSEAQVGFLAWQSKHFFSTKQKGIENRRKCLFFSFSPGFPLSTAKEVKSRLSQTRALSRLVHTSANILKKKEAECAISEKRVISKLSNGKSRKEGKIG